MAAETTDNKKNAPQKPKKSPPLHLPMSFDQAVDGLLGVKPKQQEKPASKK